MDTFQSILIYFFSYTIALIIAIGCIGILLALLKFCWLSLKKTFIG